MIKLRIHVFQTGKCLFVAVHHSDKFAAVYIWAKQESRYLLDSCLESCALSVLAGSACCICSYFHTVWTVIVQWMPTCNMYLLLYSDMLASRIYPRSTAFFTRELRTLFSQHNILPSLDVIGYLQAQLGPTPGCFSHPTERTTWFSLSKLGLCCAGGRLHSNAVQILEWSSSLQSLATS